MTRHFFIFSLVFVTAAVNAGAVTKTCPAIVAQSAVVAPVYDIAALESPAPRVDLPAHPQPAHIVVAAWGPNLGSMDSPDVQITITCMDTGVAVTGVITRSAAYTGAAAKNVLWRPRITLDLNLTQQRATLVSIWKMRLTTGVDLDHARTPPYPELKYPFRFTTTLP
ncbi:MAG: hypothetical protein JO022_08580 [Acidobacteriaceae bacterium]|nr:hypothetical protein [Acidobacteriaceae bacterium]